jgi:hypothetical protein
VRTLWLVVVAGVAGCGSYWDLRKGEELAIGCAGLLNFYPDADGDRWGDPGSTPTPACAPDEANGLTASNDLDCDDADPSITGLAGAICPQDMLGGEATCLVGLREGNSEFVGTCGESPQVAFGQASQDCQAWAGWETPEAIEQGRTGHRGLASLETEFEYNEIEDWLTAELGGAPTAVWVDLRWEGTVTTGQWVWPDGSAPTFVPPCGGIEAAPGDFWPELVPGLPESDEALSQHLDEVRQALVFDGTGWCRGVPTAAGLEPRQAHVLCERPSPDLADYQMAPEDDSGPPGAGE